MVEEWAGLAKEAIEPSGGAFADGQHPALAVLALSDDEGAGGGLIVAVIEVGHFSAPDAGGVKEFEHGAVAQAEGIGRVGDGEQALDFIRGEGFRKVAGLFARQIEIGSGIGRDNTGAAEPGKEAADTARRAI